MKLSDKIHINDKYGHLTVIQLLNEKDKHYNTLVLCQCDCGKEIKVTASHLLSGHTTSCGCMKHKCIDHSGEVYGVITVLDNYIRQNGNTKWKCRCGYCGNEFYATISSLKRGNVISCGCQNTQRRKELIKQNLGFVDGTNLSAISTNRKINKNSTTGVKGVSFVKAKKKYRAQIMFKRRVHHLGYFDSIEQAKEARFKAEKELFEPVLNEYKK